jgi:hypothetical protein
VKPSITDAFRNGTYVLPFQIEGLPTERLESAFKGACIQGYGLPLSQSFQAAWSFRLALDTGWLLEFSSACTHVGGWQEVGSLNIEFLRRHPNGSDAPYSIRSIDEFRVEKIEQMVYRDADVYAECGIALTSEDGLEIIVVAGTAPGSVSIAAPFSTEIFQPEFEVAQYLRVTSQEKNSSNRN